MQEDIENRTIALVVSTGRLTGLVLQSAIRQLLHDLERRSANKEPQIPHGKQSVKQLIGQTPAPPISRSTTAISVSLRKSPENMALITRSEKIKQARSPAGSSSSKQEMPML